jgi:hypothetical protein
MPSGRDLLTWQRLLLLLLAIFGFGQIGYWAVVAEGFEKPLDAVCASWDREASVGVALLVPRTTALDESRLEDALFRLRRARKNCRAGWLDVARQDYLSLRDDFPFPGRPVTAASERWQSLEQR